MHWEGPAARSERALIHYAKEGTKKFKKGKSGRHIPIRGTDSAEKGGEEHQGNINNGKQKKLI